MEYVVALVAVVVLVVAIGAVKKRKIKAPNPNVKLPPNPGKDDGSRPSEP